MGREDNHGVRALCARALLPLLDGMMEERDGVVRDDDVEHVHRMRVASRRVREGMAVFEACFPRKRYREWRKALRAVTRALGEARDADVQVAFLEEFLGRADGSQAPGIRLMLESKRSLRKGLQGALVRVLKEIEETGAVKDLEDYLDGIAVDGEGEDLRTPAAFALAEAMVRARVEELRVHEPSLSDAAAVQGHHAMRIAAKRLRYAMEVFRPLFDDELRQEISTVKWAQEQLGDIHDSDVWIVELGSVIAADGAGLLAGREATTYLPGLKRLLEERAAHRKETFQKFVGEWDDLARKGFLDMLLGRVGCAAQGEPEPCHAREAALDIPPSGRVALLGDVHGNLHALQAVLADASSMGVAAILDTGDTVGYGAFPEESVRLLRDRKVLSVIGNYDLKALRRGERKETAQQKASDKARGFEYAYEHLSEGSRAYLRGLPPRLRLTAGGKSILITHGSPDSMDEYVGPMTGKERLRAIARSAGADILVCGHSHVQFAKRVQGVTILNPGSVGRQDDGDPRAAYALLRLEPLKVEMRRVPYDSEAAAEAIRRSGLPESFAQMVLRGLPLEAVEEKGRKSGRGARGERLALVERISRGYLGEDAHTQKVRRLSLEIFEGLRGELGLDREQGYWLECAALLHDVGWIEGREGHHKASLRIVLEEDELPFSRRERRIVGLVARYHRKGPPSKQDAHYSSLPKEDRATVDRLAAVLRVADGLDASHSGKVASLRCHPSADAIIFHLAAEGGTDMEERDAMKKGDMLRAITGKELRFVREDAP